MMPSNVQSIDLPMDCMAWRFWTMRQPNVCSTSAPISSAVKQWFEQLAKKKKKNEKYKKKKGETEVTHITHYTMRPNFLSADKVKHSHTLGSFLCETANKSKQGWTVPAPFSGHDVIPELETENYALPQKRKEVWKNKIMLHQNESF